MNETLDLDGERGGFAAKIGVQERDVFIRADRRTVTSLGELRKV